MYKIAIPSYQRVDVLQNKTLAYLKKTNIDLNNIYLFVANEKEKQDYSTLGLNNIIVGLETIRNQRNFIRHYFQEGEMIFSIDDDITGIYTATSVKDFQLVLNLHELILNGFRLCNKINTKLWGVSAVKNAFFIFQKKPTGNLRYIVGACFGQIIDHDDFLTQTIDDKGDYERSILYYIKFGSVVRLNNVAIETSYYKMKGGMQVTRTKQRVKMSGLYLLNKYPKHCQFNANKKNKEFFEIKLKHIK